MRRVVSEVESALRGGMEGFEERKNSLEVLTKSSGAASSSTISSFKLSIISAELLSTISSSEEVAIADEGAEFEENDNEDCDEEEWGYDEAEWGCDAVE